MRFHCICHSDLRLRLWSSASRARRGQGVSYGQVRGLLTLAIETSCDDTAVAILETRMGRATLHFNELVTLPDHGNGGIHPANAHAHHQRTLPGLVQRALHSLPVLDRADEASARLESGSPSRSMMVGGVRRQTPDFVSVTRGPGMRANLQTGLDVAKGLAVAWAVPLVGVHHMQAHALTARLVGALDATTATASGPARGEQRPAFPFLSLLISGGHTMLLHSRSLTGHVVLASTIDIAVGDALDKCGRALLPLSARKAISDTSLARHLSALAFPDDRSYAAYPVARTRRDEMQRADEGKNEYGWSLSAPLAGTRQLRFSFAGLSGAVGALVSARERQNGGMSMAERLLMARTCLGAAFEHLASRVVLALEQLRKENSLPGTLVVSGGVASNSFLRFYLRETLTARGFENVELVFPPVALCTDNAAMIAWAGAEMFEAGWTSDLGAEAIPRWSMNADGPDGGVLGIDGCNYEVC